MRGIEYLILRFGLFCFFAVVTSPIVIVCVLLIQYLDSHEKVKLLKWAVAPVMLAWVFGLPWLTSKAAGHMAFGNQRFGVAIKLAFLDLRFHLAFLPVIGHWFASESEKDDEEHDA
jgi:hypothetical protein